MIQVRKAIRTRDKNGLVSWAVTYKADSLSDAVPAFYNGTLRQTDKTEPWTGNPANGYLVDATYRGLDESENPEVYDRFQITGGWREEPIEAFPLRGVLVRYFGAYVERDKLLFPEKRPKIQSSGPSFGGFGSAFGGVAGFGNVGAANGFGGVAAANISLTSGISQSASAVSDDDRNPLFGVRTYPVYYDVATHSYVRKRVPADVYRRAGTVVERLPAGFEYDGDAKAWLYDAPDRQKEGSAWRITERAKEVDKLKHLQALYLLIQKG